ncbi:MAG: hypothetical protein RIQ33_239, partial [Bacteroidota bacterium]
MNSSLLKKVKTICLTAVALVTLHVVAFGQVKESVNLPIAKDLIKQTARRIEFIENKGQWNKGDIRFCGYSSIGQMAVRSNELTFVTTNPNEVITEGKTTHEIHKWAMRFQGNNPNYKVEHGSAFETKRNYMVGEASTYATNVMAYDELKLINIYNNIDLRVYSQPNGDMEMDWIVKPGGNYNDIDVAFIGTDKIEKNRDGSLKIPLEFKNINFNIPESYQIQNGIKVQKKFNFQIVDNHVKLVTTDKIDNTLPLIIDPVLN